jgi:gliding motility-associated lipoprotein GldH
MVYEKNKEIGKDGWDKGDIAKFNTEISDNSIPYNFYINIRNSNDYPFSNVFLFVKTLYPDGKMSVDTVECYLADLNGKWLGKASGRLVDNRILFKKNVIFPMKGMYSFEFEQAMRVDKLLGIEDFGIRIEKIK